MSYYDDYDEDYEPSQEEMEEMDGMENTDVNVKPEELEIKFNTENFAAGIVSAVVSAVKKNLYDEIVAEIKKEVLDDMKETICNQANAIIKEIIDEYVNTERIKIGGNSFWDDEPIQEYSMREYAKKCIADAIKNQEFRVVTSVEKDRYGEVRARTEEFDFDTYIRSGLAIGNDIKEFIDKQIAEVRDNVNKGVKDMFDSSTKAMLSESVLKLLMANDTYKKIESNIACIASRTEE